MRDRIIELLDHRVRGIERELAEARDRLRDGNQEHCGDALNSVRRLEIQYECLSRMRAAIMALAESPLHPGETLITAGAAVQKSLRLQATVDVQFDAAAPALRNDLAAMCETCIPEGTVVSFSGTESRISHTGLPERLPWSVRVLPPTDAQLVALRDAAIVEGDRVTGDLCERALMRDMRSVLQCEARLRGDSPLPSSGEAQDEHDGQG